jgi:hypothetical protein
VPHRFSILIFGLLTIGEGCLAQNPKTRPLPERYRAVVIRTDFDNQRAWETAAKLIRAPMSGPGVTYYASLRFVEDPIFRNLTKNDLLKHLPKDYAQDFLFVVDRRALSRPDFPVLVVWVGPYEKYGRSFRTIPTQISGIEANLSIANMDFQDFADSVDRDGVFRGFPRPSR